MAVMRRPVSARRFAKSRKARSSKKTFTPPRKGGGPLNAGLITRISRNNYGFPDRLKTKLQYCDVIQLAASAGSPAVWQFRMTSCFDPDYTGTGHQPQWFDQLAGVYQAYRVLGSKITVTFSPNQVSDIEANDKGPYIVGITGNENVSFGSANYPALLEDANSVNTVLGDKQGANNVKTLSLTYSPMRDMDSDPLDQSLRALTSNNPSRNFYANVWALDMSEASNQDVVAKVQIEFMVEFSTPRINTVS